MVVAGRADDRRRKRGARLGPGALAVERDLVLVRAARARGRRRPRGRSGGPRRGRSSPCGRAPRPRRPSRSRPRSWRRSGPMWRRSGPRMRPAMDAQCRDRRSPRPGVEAGRRASYPEEVRRGLVALVVSAVAVSLLAGPAQGALRLARVTGGLSSPVDLASTASQSGRLYVVEQEGVVRVIREREPPERRVPRHPRPGRLLRGAGPPRARLPPALRPERAPLRELHEQLGRHARRRSTARTRRGRRSTSRPRASFSPSDQPYSNHNGGDLAFGRDGFLYVPLGDGGSGGDPGNRAQNMSTRLGKIVRINVSTAGKRIVALGLRNPWRITLDRQTGRFWIGDVGQGSREEVDVFNPAAAGLENYGWRRFEGTLAPQRLHAPAPGKPLRPARPPVRHARERRVRDHRRPRLPRPGRRRARALLLRGLLQRARLELRPAKRPPRRPPLALRADRPGQPLVVRRGADGPPLLPLALGRDGLPPDRAVAAPPPARAYLG